MKNYYFRLLNVFAETVFGGNPLCVFENGEGLSEEQMQALALQFNLSETVFVLPSTIASARMRIFTTNTEMPFAGHPSLGTAHVVRDLFATGDRLTLECRAGVVPLDAWGDRWSFVPPIKGAPQIKAVDASSTQVAAMLGLQTEDLLTEPLWVNTGSDQLLVALKTRDAVRRVQPNGAHVDAWPQNSQGRRTVYVFAFEQTEQAEEETVGGPSDDEKKVLSRYFFVKSGGGIAEDPGTGSACANLGAWWLAQGGSLPARFVVAQGEQIQRPSHLSLAVSADGQIRVGGRVQELGRGFITI